MWIRVAADLAVSKQSSGHTQQLPFPHGEILPVLRHLRVKRVGEVVHLKTRTGVIHMWENKCGLNCIIWKAVTYHFFDMRLLQGFPNLRVGELIPRIQVGPREEKKTNTTVLMIGFQKKKTTKFWKDYSEQICEMMNSQYFFVLIPYLACNMYARIFSLNYFSHSSSLTNHVICFTSFSHNFSLTNVGYSFLAWLITWLMSISHTI